MRFASKTVLLTALLTATIAAHAQDAAPAPEEQPAAPTEQTTAPTPAEQTTAPTSAEQTAAPTSAELPAGIAPPPEGMGQIVFFRESRFVGGAIGYKVREGETELGKLSNGVYFVHVATPGAHAYTVHSEAKDVLNIEVEAGETYYVAGGVSMGVLAGRPNLSPSSETAFTAIAGKLRPAKPLKPKK